MEQAHPRGRRFGAALALVLLLALALTAALAAAGAASAQETFTQCATCHTYTGPGDAFHSKTMHSQQACTVCHVNGFSAADHGLVPSACASCHGTATQVISQQAAHSDCTTSGCHGSTPPPAPVTTVMTAKVSPTTVRVNKTVTVSGAVTPAAQLAGAKVSILVNRKVGTKWVKAKSTTVTAKATGAYSWKYKVSKKGSYQVKVSVKATATYTKKTVTKTFKAK